MKYLGISACVLIILFVHVDSTFWPFSIKFTFRRPQRVTTPIPTTPIPNQEPTGSKDESPYLPFSWLGPLPPYVEGSVPIPRFPFIVSSNESLLAAIGGLNPTSPLFLLGNRNSLKP